MDDSRPLTVVLHLDYAPYDERTGEGWEPDLIGTEIKAALWQLLRVSPDRLALVDLEVIEEEPDTSGYETGLVDRTSDATYRQHLTDSGRGGLLR